jgi:hypothetical protein
MNKAEIMTLLASKVPASKIRVSIMAGKLSTILMRADQDIALAEDFRRDADWTEMLRIMEGTLDKEVEHQADDQYSGKKRSNKF